MFLFHGGGEAKHDLVACRKSADWRSAASFSVGLQAGIKGVVCPVSCQWPRTVIDARPVPSCYRIRSYCRGGTGGNSRHSHRTSGLLGVCVVSVAPKSSWWPPVTFWSGT